MPSATIKLFLQFSDAKSLRTAEISNWTGKAVTAPRTELDALLARDELANAGERAKRVVPFTSEARPSGEAPDSNATGARHAETQ